MENKIITNSCEETKEFAIAFSKTLKKGDILCLRGDLGAGKTAFVQGLAKGLGISDYVTSPTFTIVNEYKGDKCTLYHFDVYRIEDSDEMYEIGYEEYIYSDSVCVIEWPECIEDILPDSRYEINIKKNMDKGDNYREITIDKVDI